MGTAIAFWFGAVVFAALAIRADLFFRYVRWIDRMAGRASARDDRVYDWVVARIFVRGSSAVAAIFLATMAILAMIRASSG